MRLLDIFLALALCSLLILLIPLVALLSAIKGEGKIFYMPIRCGRGGRPFRVVKFASMTEQSPAIGSQGFVDEDDKRILPYGFFLRQWKLNEIPQCINVLIGNMSFVGPRPLAPETYSLCCKRGYKANYRVKPGITSIASVELRNEEDIIAKQQDKVNFYTERILPVKLELDQLWVDKKNLRSYLIIVLATATKIVAPHWNWHRHWFKSFNFQQVDDLFVGINKRRS